MKSILIHLEKAEKTLRNSFEPQSNSLPPHVSKSIEKSIKEFQNGQTISLGGFKQKHFSLK